MGDIRPDHFQEDLKARFPMDVYTLKLEQTRDGRLTKITNDTPYTVYLGMVPEKPKRKIQDIGVVRPGMFVVYDYKMPLQNIYLRIQ